MSERLSLYLCSAAAFVLPFDAIGEVSFKAHFYLSLFEYFIVLGTPFSFYSIYQKRDFLLYNKMVIVLVLMIFTQTIPLLVSPTPMREARSLARNILQFICIISLSNQLSENKNGKIILYGLVTGALCSTIVSLSGYLLILSTSDNISLIDIFSHVDTFLGIPNVPRLSGTYGLSPQHFGECLLIAIIAVVLLPPNASRLWHWTKTAVLCLAIGSLLMTLSFAFICGIPLLAGLVYIHFFRTRKFLYTVCIVSASLVTIVTFLMNIGPPTNHCFSNLVEEISVEKFDTARTLHAFNGENNKVALVKQNNWIYSSFKTTYLDAKEAAFEIGMKNLPWGSGYERYADLSRERIVNLFGIKWCYFYPYPHCALLTAFATSGFLGVLTFLLFIFVIFKRTTRSDIQEAVGKKNSEVILLGVLVFYLISLNIDIMTLRTFWFLLSVVVGFYTRAKIKQSHYTTGK